MLSDKDLLVLLCLENVDNYDILVSQLGSGEMFGPSQQINLILQGSDENQLEVLRWDLQDCAFPLISGISTCTTFGNTGLHPDAVMIVLADRDEICVRSGSSFTELDENRQFNDLLGLVQYSQIIAEDLSGCNLSNTPIAVLGDLAHIAASVVSNQLPGTLKTGQIIALEGAEEVPPRQLKHHQGQMRKVTKFCLALSQWWNGQQAHPDKKAKFGTKFVNTKQHNANGKPTSYFFSSPVDLSGPTTFSARLDLDCNPSYIAKIKTETDAAHEILARLEGARTEQDQISTSQIAHL